MLENEADEWRSEMQQLQQHKEKREKNACCSRMQHWTLRQHMVISDQTQLTRMDPKEMFLKVKYILLCMKKEWIRRRGWRRWRRRRSTTLDQHAGQHWRTVIWLLVLFASLCLDLYVLLFCRGGLHTVRVSSCNTSSNSRWVGVALKKQKLVSSKLKKKWNKRKNNNNKNKNSYRKFRSWWHYSFF